MRYVEAPIGPALQSTWSLAGVIQGHCQWRSSGTGHQARLLHDVTAKPAVVSTPVNDQVLIYTPELKETIVCKFLAKEIMS